MSGEEVPINPDIPSLARVTLSYVVSEDRVRLSGLDTEGRIIRLWFTARLLNSLVPHLIECHTELEMQRATPASDAAAPDKGAEEEQVVVSGEHASTEALISEIDLSTHHTGLSLVFKEAQKGGCASFTLSVSALAIWNRGLKKCFEQAGWATEVFSRASNTPIFAAHTPVTIH